MYIHSRNEGKAPEGFSARSTVRASELRWVGATDKHRLDVESARGSGGWVRKRGAGGCEAASSLH